MDYRDIVPFIFWPWLAFSCYVLFKRSRAKRAGERDKVFGAAPATPNVSGAVVRPPSLPPDTAPSSMATEPAPLPPPAVRPTGPGFDGPVLPGQSIFDAPKVPEPTAVHKPIPELVEGIALPCDLTPLVGAERPIGARTSVAFVTRGFPAHEVGQQVGAELRRLGYELAPRHATEVVATRGDDWLAVAVHDHAGTIDRGGRPAFPGAGEAGVVVELWTE